MKLSTPQTISRFIRRLRGKCVNCGRQCNYGKEKYLYCSTTCMCYDGVFSVRTGWKRDFKYSEGYYCNYRDIDNEKYL